MVSINVPQGVWPGRCIVAALNDFVAENDSCQTVNTFKRANDPVALNMYALLKEVTAEVADSSIGMFVPVSFGNFI